MIASKYYPKLTSVIKLDSLPDQLGFIEDGLENLLDDIFVRDYQIVKSKTGDSISYYLVLKIYKRMGIEIPGAFTLLLNPPAIGDPDPLSSEIPVSIQVQAEILKYVSNFDVLQFSAEPEAFQPLSGFAWSRTRRTLRRPYQCLYKFEFGAGDCFKNQHCE